MERKHILCACLSCGFLTLVVLIPILLGITNLSEEDQLLVIKSDVREVTNGPASTWVWIGHKSEIRRAHLLSQTQYIFIQDSKSGLKRLQKGPGRYFLEPYENFEGSGEPKDAVTLTLEEYVHVRDILTGEVMIVRGPVLYFPTSPYHEISEKHNVVHLLEFEAMVIREGDGNFSYHYGWTADDNTGILGPEAEIVEFPWSNAVNMETNRSTKAVKKIDMRIQQLPFYYDDVRTRDSVEFELEGIIFWQVENVSQMVQNITDPPSVVWNRLRYRIAEAAKAENYLGFLENGASVKNSMMADELVNENSFYSSRGLKLHSMLLTEVELHSDALANELSDQVADSATERFTNVLNATTVNELELRRSRLEYQKQSLVADHALFLQAKNLDLSMQQQTSAAQLAALAESTRAEQSLRLARNGAKLEATKQNSSHNLRMLEVEYEKAYEAQRVELIALQEATARKEATYQGSSQGLELGKSTDEYLKSLNETMPSLIERVNLYMQHQEIERHLKTTAHLGSSKGQLYVTPEDANVYNLGSRGEL